MASNNEYLKTWSKKNSSKRSEINRRYYLKNKGYLNKSRTNPWMNENIIQWIKSGNSKKIISMLKILRPEKDRIIGICTK